MKFLHHIRRKEPLKYLKGYDIIILTVTLFGYFIYTSNYILITSLHFQNTSQESSASTFSSMDNWNNLIIQMLFMFLALSYLYLRHFDFRQLQLKKQKGLFLKGVGIFLFVGLCSDIYNSLFSGFNYFSLEAFRHIDFSMATTFQRF